MVNLAPDPARGGLRFGLRIPNREEGLAQQIPRFPEIMGDHRTDPDLQASYLSGIIAEMQGTVAALGAAGLQYLILTPLVDDPRQLELITKHTVEPLA